MVRAVRYLVAEAGIRQLLDIGTGLPTVNNTHQVAQATAPECRIVYVDSDPVRAGSCACSAHQHAEGVTNYLHADVRDPERILHEAARTLDFTRPVGLMLLGIIKYGGVARKP
ncbi:MAG: SAM-dependent methyltransferase [Pseudonocardiaceae bacterium]